jgi:hypothetical protein
MDILHGTVGKFDITDNGKRHKTLYNFKSARENFDVIENHKNE